MMILKRLFRSVQFGLWTQPVAMPLGPRLFGDPMDGTFQMIARGAYGDFTIRSLGAASTSSNFLDIGANIGYFTVALANHFSGTTYCFEPNAKTFSYLQQNLAENKIVNALAICAGLSDTSEYAALLNTKRFHSGAASLVRNFGEHSKRVTLLSPHLLRSIVHASGSIVAKIDVEGAELGVVRALQQSNILSRTERLVIEMSSGTNSQENMQEIREILTGCGLTLTERAGTEHFGDELYIRKN